MIEIQPVTTLGERNAAESNRDREVETLSLELDVLGEPVCFQISVARGSARLSDIAPLAQALSTKLALATLRGLRASGKCVPCRKGCSACCSYLVPLSVPEAFRLSEELSAMPADKSRTLLQSSLDTARTILEQRPREFDMNGLAPADSGIRSNRLGTWYGGLKLRCPFLSDGLCVIYENRPMACREHVVTGSAALCDVEGTNQPQVVKMPVSILECLGQLTAELEQSDVEAVMLPLALPWARENIERSRRTWPAVTMVERFVDILQEAAAIHI